ncbi:SapC family protein [Zavarzinia aquatilis]|uniref:SapC family protein n=1 Tax=Zavarzinia aquatilis TaxID=2211142 RepID=A0A317EAJ7_9PROT|nr:SapC family protein [Zavarzinia aquatilis]PWR24137.1 SapC family protein [Zavarzinia aquatilis]
MMTVTTGTKTAEVESADARLPLFYERPEILDSGRHGTIALQPLTDFGFARKTNSLPVTAEEFFEMAGHYPIVFVPGAEAAPVVVIGLGGDHNLFVEADGRWAQGHPVPAYVRRYPFILFEPKGGERLPLCVDMAAGVIGEKAEGGEGEPLFDGAGPTAVAKHALAFCEDYQRQIVATRALSAALMEADLLVERKITIAAGAGGRHEMVGLLIVDEEKFNALPDDTVLAWRRNGYLAAVYAHLLSMRRWPDLALRFEGTVAKPATTN